ncbi:MAG: hypothetical protein ACOCZ5_02000 [bacterium]
MVNLRYTLPKKQFNKEQLEIKEKIKIKFKKTAIDNNIDIMELDTIIIGRETFYNPFKYKSFNKWIRKF